MSVRIADPKRGGKKNRRIPLWYHGCALFVFLFVLFMLNIFYMFVPVLGVIFGILYFFYIQRGGPTEEFDHSLAFLKNFRVSDTGQLLRAIVVSPLVAMGMFAPFRALFLGFLWFLGWTQTWTESFSPAVPASNAVFSLCGIILGITAGSMVWVRGLRLRSQLMNLPSSTIGSVAIGLAELKGIAQPIEKGVQDKGNTIPILLTASHVDDEGMARNETIRAPFYLQDDTGRILVDPGGAEFWDGSGSFLWSPIRSIYLEKHYAEEILPWRSTSMLLPGDSVYVIGNVEENKDASPAAADADRLVIRPASGLEDAGFFKRLLFGQKTKEWGSDIYNVFFLTDVTELSAAELLSRGLRTVWIWMLVWVALSLTLIFL